MRYKKGDYGGLWPGNRNVYKYENVLKKRNERITLRSMLVNKKVITGGCKSIRIVSNDGI
jgi:hypothetical protein